MSEDRQASWRELTTMPYTGDLAYGSGETQLRVVVDRDLAGRWQAFCAARGLSQSCGMRMAMEWLMRCLGNADAASGAAGEGGEGHGNHGGGEQE